MYFSGIIFSDDYIRSQNDDAIKKLIVECKFALKGLEFELAVRSRTETTTDVERCSNIIKYTADRIQKHGLSESDKIRLGNPDQWQESVDLTNDQAIPRGYGELLWIISKVVSPGHALLVKCTPPRNIERLSIGRKAKVVQFVMENRSLLFCSVLGMNKIARIVAFTKFYLEPRRHRSYSGNHPNEKYLAFKSNPWLNSVLNPEAFESQHQVTGFRQPEPQSRPELHSSWSSTDEGALRIPRNMTISPILLFQQLNKELKEFVTVLVFLSKAEMSEQLLLGGCSPRASWNNAGEMEWMTAPGLVPVLTNNEKVKSAIQSLMLHNLLISTPGPEFLDLEQQKAQNFSVEPNLRQHIGESTLDPNLWKSQATKLVFHVFPSDRDIEPLYYTKKARLYLPQVQQVISYFSIPGFIELFSIPELTQGVECCLSSSAFLKQDWKYRSLTTAQNILTRLENGQLSARLWLRTRALSHLFPDGPWKADTTQQIYIPVDPRSNAYSGEVMLSNAQEMIERNELQKATLELERFKPWNTAASTKEIRVMHQITFLKGKICRFGGDFIGAKEHLTDLFEHITLHSEIQSKATSHLIAVFCELGNMLKAMEFLRSEWEGMEYHTWYQGKRSRQKLISAETYLMQGVWIIKDSKGVLLEAPCGFSSPLSGINHPDGARDSLKTAKKTYEELREMYIGIPTAELGKVRRLNYFRISAGLAMILHLQGQLEAAFDKWEFALTLAQFYWGQDFAMMISLYSMSDITLKLGRVKESQEYMKRAEEIFRSSGRQNYLLALGSIWFDEIGVSIQCSGGQKIIEAQN
ncbi:MAG: hypothetical protein M1834_000936 [Cirrosporium novae-zelandiae]|nr:MAG: hypothetical protein M1834_000936 [Cirrosporium novae-zelandiae]